MAPKHSQKSAWERAKKYGIDTTLLEINLKKTFTQRVIDHQSALELAETLRAAGEKYYAKSRKAN